MDKYRFDFLLNNSIIRWILVIYCNLLLTADLLKLIKLDNSIKIVLYLFIIFFYFRYILLLVLIEHYNDVMNVM